MFPPCFPSVFSDLDARTFFWSHPKWNFLSDWDNLSLVPNPSKVNWEVTKSDQNSLKQKSLEFGRDLEQLEPFRRCSPEIRVTVVDSFHLEKKKCS